MARVYLRSGFNVTTAIWYNTLLVDYCIIRMDCVIKTTKNVCSVKLM